VEKKMALRALVKSAELQRGVEKSSVAQLYRFTYTIFDECGIYVAINKLDQL